MGAYGCLKSHCNYANADGGFWCSKTKGKLCPAPKLDLVIAGGESGRNARPTDGDWFDLIFSQCSEAGNVAHHLKQLGDAYDMKDTRTFETIGELGLKPADIWKPRMVS